MKTFKMLFPVVIIAFFTVSCSVRCKKGEGPVVSKSRNIEAYTKLVCDIPCYIYITQGNTRSCIVNACENLQEFIITEAKGGGKLKITSKRCISDLDTIRIDLTVPELKGLKIKGSGKMFSTGVFTGDKMEFEIDGSGSINFNVMLNSLETYITGAGDANLKGSVQKHKIDIKGSGNVSAGELNTYECKVDIEGSGSCHLFVNNLLKANINGSGDVFYKGSPEIKTDVKGSGKVQKE
jgi:hypothetical protein